MDKICDKEKCVGCHACYNACKRDAITMELLSGGFLYPTIDSDKCVDCGLCKSVCPVNNECEKVYPSKVYLAWNNDASERLGSSSGGVFSAIAKQLLSDGGVVVGASYDEHMNVCHLIIESYEELYKLQGSKYVQSSIGNTYSKVKSLLKSGRTVYFVGTPCQIAGLRSYLHKDYDNLLTSDLICHGCPSNELFKLQIHELEQRFNSKIVDLKFRSKVRFGQGYDMEIKTEDGRIRFLNPDVVPYFYGFWKNISLRESCYQCKYATPERVSDVTLADYWRVKKYHKGIKTAKGTSLILANTHKGQELFTKCSGNMVLIEDSIENAIKIQGHLSHPVKKPQSHILFVGEYDKFDWDFIKKKYLTPSIKYAIKMRVRNFIKTITLYKLWK